MENIILNLEETINLMVKCRNLPAVTEKIDSDIVIRNGKLESVYISFKVGEMLVCVKWEDYHGYSDKNGKPLGWLDLVAHELDGLFHVDDDLYERIVGDHLEGCDFERTINGVSIEAYYDGDDTYMIAASKKPYYDFEDLRMRKYRSLTTDFCIDKYFEVRERMKERRIIADERERLHLEHLRKIA